MFATATALAPHAAAGTYRQMGVVTGVGAATPHRLVMMLFDGFDDALLQALGALRDGAIDTKCRAIGRAARIVEEGLRASLDLNAGGKLAADLRELYAYVSLRLGRSVCRRAWFHNRAGASRIMLFCKFRKENASSPKGPDV